MSDKKKSQDKKINQVKTRDLSKPLAPSTFDVFEASMDTVKAGLYHATQTGGGRSIKGGSTKEKEWKKSADKLTTKNPKHKIFKGTYHYQPTAKEIDRSLKRITKLNKKK